MKTFFAALLVSALCACASSETPVAATPVVTAAANSPAASGAAATRQNCHRESLIGTNRFQTVCETTSDEDRQASLDGIHKMAGTGAAAGGSGFSTGH